MFVYNGRVNTTRPPAWLDPRTAYLHIPFCGHHCGYCDFAVTAGQDHLIELYLDALEMELASLGTPRPVESLFLGGGTPTYLSATQLDRLMTAIDRWLPRIDPTTAECSIESTPESWTADKVRVLADRGINRASIGVQSFQSHILRALDRQHGVDQIGRAVDLVRSRFPAVSFDLIFAAPGQTLQEWEADLQAALRYEPHHLSTYGLTYEKGTPLWKAMSRGQVTPQPEETELAMYLRSIELLTESGFEHYEISNFARPGQESKHNQRYWANEAYYGFGVGAARYVEGRRELNVRNTADYIRKVLAGESPTFQSETLTPRDRAFETMATQLRRSCGIDRQGFDQQTGYPLDDLVGPVLTVLINEGLLLDDGQAVRLTAQGKPLADGIIAQLMKAA